MSTDLALPSTDPALPDEPTPLGALAGIRVLDFTQMMLGPFATQTLGDLGADVIKVERPGRGEWERGLAIQGRLLGDTSPAFLAMNRNKRSVAADLKHPEVVEALLALGATCDVVVENFRPGVMERLGLGYADFRARRDDVIYCSGSGWGQQGRFAEERRPGQDLLIQAMAGIAAGNGRRDDPPIPTGTSMCDATTAQSLTIGILAALLARERQGIGQRVEVDLFTTAIAIQCQEIAAMVNGGGYAERSEAGVGQPWIDAPFGIYRTADGYVALAMTPLASMAELVGDAELARLDPWKDRDAVKARLDDAFPARSTADWVDALLAMGAWAAPVRTVVEAVDELRAEGSPMVFTVDHPTAGSIELIGCPVTLDRTPWSVQRPPPLVGQHTAEVLADVVDEDRLAALMASGALA